MNNREADLAVRTETYESAGDSTGAGPRSAAFLEAAPVPAQIGPFAVERLIGQGGMGKVYAVRQLHPPRPAALKIIDPGKLSPERRRRFDDETRFLARLSHPGIATIYESGTLDLSGEQVPYFLMELVDAGRAITDYAAAEKLSIAKRLGLLAEVCDALQHAHQKGIIHRDLKPQNVLVDADGRPKILDFGVARALEGDGNDEATLEHTGQGQLVGTLPYMSPEQAGGDCEDLDTRTDVYSLGVILFELLAGRRPHKLSGLPLAEALRTIREDQPARLSTLDRKFRGDLETIAAKALEREPARRYQSPAELAADIRRHLNHEPIHARRIGPIARTARWCRRRPAAAALAATIIAALVATPIAAVTWATREARLRAEAQRGFEQADRAVKNYVKAVQDEETLSDIKWQPMRLRLLADAKEYYEEFVRTHGDDPQRVPQLAAAFFDLGFINDESGNKQQSLEAYTRACVLYERAADDNPTLNLFQSNLATSFNNLGVLQSDMGDSEAALVSYGQAIEFRRRLADKDPNVTEFRSALAASFNNLGALQSATGDSDAALVSFGQAIEIVQRLADDNPAVTQFQNHLAMCFNNLGIIQRETGDSVAALASYGQAMEILQRLADDNPTVTEFQNHLAESFNNLGILQSDTGDSDAALVSYDRAIEIKWRLADDNPTVTEFQHGLAEGFNNVGNLQRATGDSDAALVSYGQAIEIGQRLADDNPTVTQFQSVLAASFNNLGELQSDMGDSDAAMASYRKAIPILQKLLDADPAAMIIQQSLMGTALGNIGRAHWSLGDRSAAIASLREAVAHHERAVQLAPGNIKFRSRLAESLETLRALTGAAGEAQSAALRRAGGAGNAEELVLAAGEYSQCVLLVGAGEAVFTLEHAAARKEYARLAIETLREAIAAGFSDSERLNDPAFDPIRDDPEFQAVIGELE